MITSAANNETVHQRSRGEVMLEVGAKGLVRMREGGAAKVRLPQGRKEAILINTSGGMAGGDDYRISIEAGNGAELQITTQAAERVYRSLGPPAVVRTSLKAGAEARLMWLPQELILFEGAALDRRLTVELAETASFLAVESLVMGRLAMGETARHVSVRDQWRIMRGGKLIHAESLRIDGERPESAATLGTHLAMATVLHVAADAEQRLDAVREVLSENDGASAWDGKLVARLVARDGFELRKALIPVLSVLTGEAGLPKVWSM
jgi:urease accessory protein